MFEQVNVEKFAKEAIDTMRLSIEEGTKNLGLLQDETIRNFELAQAAGSRLQNQLLSAGDQWKKIVLQSRQAYSEALQNGLDMLSNMYNGNGNGSGNPSVDDKKKKQ